MPLWTPPRSSMATSEFMPAWDWDTHTAHQQPAFFRGLWICGLALAVAGAVLYLDAIRCAGPRDSESSIDGLGKEKKDADERNEKPRSNGSPATNSTDDTTRPPAAHNKLTTDGGKENLSDPDACADERDASGQKPAATWYMATGAARHATGDSSLFRDLVEQPEDDGLCVRAADGTLMPVRGRGSVVTDTVELPDVYYVPGLWTNLVSVGQLAELDYSVGFGRGACVVNSAAGGVVGRAHAAKDGLYEVDYLKVPLDMP